MEELFANISEQVRARTKFWIDMALIQPDLVSALKTIKSYLDFCNTEEEKEYVIFNLISVMERLQDENNND